MNCHKGGFPTKRHNEVRDISAGFMSQVCYSVVVEPQLQPLSGENFTFASTHVDDEARSDICAPGFWGNGFQRAFFDIRVCNPNAQSYRNLNVQSVYKKQEQEKKRAYEERIRNVEMGTFTPLVFSIQGGSSRSTQITFKRMASLLADKQGDPYSQVINWIRYRLSFSLIRSSINAIRGSRTRAPIPFQCPLSFVSSVVEASL